jgi:predicted MPP superfamily phosphohydrolase
MAGSLAPTPPGAQRMKPVIDPRLGDIEDDSSSTKSRPLYAIAGTLLAEISFTKLAAAWLGLIIIPGIAIGLAPLVLSIWLAETSRKAAYSLTAVLPAVILIALIALGWLAARPLYRMAERSFWSLNAVLVQPGYALFREGLRHAAGTFLPYPTHRQRAITGVATALGAGLLLCALGLIIAALIWPATRWTGSVNNLSSPHLLLLPALANGVAVVACYLAAAAMVWAIADASMAQPQDLDAFDEAPNGAQRWRVAQLSDLHAVGERYGFRIESGRAGPRGNNRLKRILLELERIHASDPVDLILMTGDMTDAGSSAEWAEFLDALSLHPALLERTLILPGNHDVNVVDRANPARFDLPASPMKRLRQMRTLSAMEAVQGKRVRVIDRGGKRLGPPLTEVVAQHRDAIISLANKGTRHHVHALGRLWADIFPMVLPPASEDGLGALLLDSNSDTHFSFTNALGMISAAQAQGVTIAADAFPQARWIVALHHHLVEYPKPAKAFSERIGTALINGSWAVRQFSGLRSRALIMHGHRHVDWAGDCGGLRIVSAPSPVMGARDCDATWFYIHNLAAGSGARRALRLLSPERVEVPGEPA